MALSLALLLPSAALVTAYSLPPATRAVPMRTPRSVLLASQDQIEAPARSGPPWLRPALAATASMLFAAQPALAKAKAVAVPFALFGKSAAQLFPVQNLSLVSWLLYIFLPRWQQTKKLALIAPCVHSVLYSLILVHMVKFPTPGLTVDFSSLAGIMPGFAIPDGAFAGWLHYCVFDPLVGLGIVLDAKQQQVPHLLCVPCAAVSPAHPRGTHALALQYLAPFALRVPQLPVPHALRRPDGLPRVPGAAHRHPDAAQAASSASAEGLQVGVKVRVILMY